MPNSDSETHDPCKQLSIGSEGLRRDSFRTYKRVREECPVAHADDFLADDGGLTVLTRYEDVRKAGGDAREASVRGAAHAA